MRELILMVDEREWERLQSMAACRQVSPEELAHKVLSHWLQMTEDDWQKRMELLLRAFRGASEHLRKSQPPTKSTASNARRD